MPVDTEDLNLTELIQLRTEVEAAMIRRFQKPLALVFSDVVGSTPYFQRHGDVAGRALQQRHVDALTAQLAPHGGRLVDTAGDGAFTCFPTADDAVRAMIALLRAVEAESEGFAAEHRLSLRVGIHHGPVLTDGALVSGDAVNVCARIAAGAKPEQLLLSRDAHAELSGGQRALCKRLPPIELKGVTGPVEVYAVSWRERRIVPSLALVVETGETFPLPQKDVIRFGRLERADTPPAVDVSGADPGNDIVLRLPDPEASAAISRWHFELRRQSSGLLLRSVTDRPTVVAGQPIAKGEEVRVGSGATIRVSDVLTVELVGDERQNAAGASVAETRMPTKRTP